MVPFAQIPPYVMKAVMVLDGWKMRRDDEFNWLLSKRNKYIAIPKMCKTLPFELMNLCFELGELRGQHYLDLLAQAQSIPDIGTMDAGPTVQ
jgi:hypothetical protein